MDKEIFVNYMESKNHAQSTQKSYLKYVEHFLNWYKCDPINCKKKDILDYLAYLKKYTRQQNISRRSSLTALNHYFTALLRADILSQNPVAFIKLQGTNRKKLYKIYTPDELMQLADNFYVTFISGFDDSYLKNDKTKKEMSFLSRHRNYAMLTFIVYQGLRTCDLSKISLNDIDFNKAKIKITGGKQCTSRTLPIQATQMGALIHYINTIRPLFLDFCGETDKLFFSLSTEQHDKTFIKPIKKITKQVKTIDRNFTSFAQIRASVITHWIQTEGLRKAQYLAGHRHINATEEYLPNNLDDLINDINKLHPFDF